MSFGSLPLLRLVKFPRLSVGTCVYASIAVIAILTIAASMVALISFRTVGSSMQSLTDDRYPVVEISRDLAQAVARTVAVSPQLADVVKDEERGIVIGRLGDADQSIRAAIEKLAARGALDRVYFTTLTDKLRAEIAKVDDAARQRISIEIEKNKKAAALNQAGTTFQQALISEIDGSQFNLMLGFEKVEGNGTADQIRARVKSLAEKDLAVYGAGLTLLAEGHQLFGLLREMIVLDRPELLVPARDRYGALSKRVVKALQDGEKVAADKKRKAATEALLAFGGGKDNLFDLRVKDFANRKALGEKLKSTAEAASALNWEVEQIVIKAKSEAAEAANVSKSMISMSSLWLFVIVGVSLVAASCIAFFYVRPHIVRRLARLSVATQLIAEGELNTEIDCKGSDEIAAVASAVIVFRDAAAEKIRLENLSAEQRKQADDERRRADEQRKIAEQQRVKADEDRRRADEERLQNESERRKNAENQARAAEEQAAAMAALASGLAALSHGDLTCAIGDDVAAAYAEIRGDFNSAVAQLHETIAVIVDSNREISNASAEISASTTDLSQRTEEQAASLEQTSASMEEIAATVKKNAENAQSASKSASDTQVVAERGGAVVENAIKAMARIQDSSQKIGDIISVIDEIARQTNLLALNAAVEAARAGEAGRGFAVVASEVRNLAQRSAQAAKDIKNLITTSTGLVQDGVDLVNKTGGTLTEIVDSIKRVAMAVADIATASSEQSSGIEQVNRALTSMDDATQQNSALVEQNAATAKILEQQVRTMDERMAMFRLSGEAADDAEPDAANRKVA